jgi:hypothetical protein
MITLSQYFGAYHDHPDATPERKANAEKLLLACANLEGIAKSDGVKFPDNPITKSGVSGEGNGGFRPQFCKTGAAHSSHKEGLAVDRYDYTGEIDKWCMLNSGDGGKLEQCGIYIEHPSKTEHWSHWTIHPPASGHRVYYP